MRQDPPALIALIGLGLSIVMVTALIAQSHGKRDLGLSFHPSARAWLETGNPYPLDSELPNLNPPTSTALYLPVAPLSIREAAIVWTALGALVFAATWVWIGRRLSLTAAQTRHAAGALCCTWAGLGVWWEGQFVWLLLPWAALSWDRYRQGRSATAGVWLGVVIAAKPSLALAAIPLGLRATVGAGAMACGITGTAIGLSGWPPWQAWLEQSSRVAWLATPGNVSIWGLLARVSGYVGNDYVSMNELRWAWFVVLPGWLGLVVVVRRLGDTDRRWILSLMSAVWVSPIGWSMYLALTAPALTGLWARGAWTRAHSVGLVMFALPTSIAYGPLSEAGLLGTLTIGSWYAWSLIIVMAACLSASRSCTRAALRQSKAG